MYHEEKVINGVLCHRGTPNGEWIEYSKEALTVKIDKTRQYYLEKLDKLSERLQFLERYEI